MQKLTIVLFKNLKLDKNKKLNILFVSISFTVLILNTRLKRGKTNKKETNIFFIKTQTHLIFADKFQ